MNIRDKVLAYLYERKEGTVEEIAREIREEVDEVQATLRVLENEKIVRKVEKGLIFKKTVYELTAYGLEEAKKAYEKVQQKANELQQIIMQGDEIPEEYMDLIPLMITLSLLDAMLLQDIIFFDMLNM